MFRSILQSLFMTTTAHNRPNFSSELNNTMVWSTCGKNQVSPVISRYYSLCEYALWSSNMMWFSEQVRTTDRMFCGSHETWDIWLTWSDGVQAWGQRGYVWLIPCGWWYEATCKCALPAQFRAELIDTEIMKVNRSALFSWNGNVDNVFNHASDKAGMCCRCYLKILFGSINVTSPIRLELMQDHMSVFTREIMTNMYFGELTECFGGPMQSVVRVVIHSTP